MPVEYNAGKSVSTWEMNLAPLRAGVLEAKRLYLELAQAQQAAQQQAVRGTQTVVPRSEAPGAIPVGSGSGVDRAALAASKLAAEQSKAALAAQRLATEEQRTAVQAANVERAESQAASAALRLSQQQAKANTAASGGQGAFSRLAQTARGLQSALGVVGIGIGAAAIVQGVRDAGQYAVGLRQTEGVLRQLSGSQERYNELTQIAAQNQRLFGGSLADNYAPLTGVLALSNQTGASLAQLNQVSQLLLAKAPGKSAGDAFFGLGEFLSGKGAEAALSLADQFNLNKKAVADLAGEGVSAEQRLSGLTRLLAQQGVTAATLQARLTDQSQAYNQLGASGEQAYIRLGDAAAQAGVPLAKFVTDGLNGLNMLLKFNSEIQQTGNNLLAGSKDYDDYRARVEAANAALPPFAAQLTLLGPAAYAAQKALLAQGGSMQSAAVDAQKLGDTANVVAVAVDLMRGRIEKGYDASKLSAQGQAALGAEMLRLAGTSEANRLTIDALGTAYQSGQIGADQLKASVEAMATAQQAAAGQATAASDQHAAATATLANQLDIAKVATSAQEQALTKAAQAAYAARDAGGGLTAQARAAARALLESGDAGAAAAALLARSSTQVDVMTAALYRQAAAAREAAGGKSGSNVNATAQKQRDWQAAQDLAAAQQRYTEATESSAQRVTRLRGELGGLTEGTAAYVDKQTQLAQAEKTLASERTRAGTSAEKLATKEAGAANAEAVARRDALRRIEDMTHDHYDRLRQLQEDYQLSSSRKREDYQLEHQRLLAQGQIEEAKLLEQKYTLQARRDAEDAARAQQRQNEQAAQQIADAEQQAGLKAADRERKRQLSGLALPGGAAPDVAAARQAQAEAALAGGGAPGGGGGLLRLEFAPISLLLDGQTVAQATYAAIEARLDADWSEKGMTILVTAPPGGGQGGGVGGPRP